MNEPQVPVPVPSLGEPRLTTPALKRPRSFVHASDVVVAVPLQSKPSVAVLAFEWRPPLVHRRLMGTQMRPRQKPSPAHITGERTRTAVRQPLVPAEQRTGGENLAAFSTACSTRLGTTVAGSVGG